VIYAPVRAAMHFMSPGNDEIAIAGVSAYNNWLHRSSARSLRSVWSVSR